MAAGPEELSQHLPAQGDSRELDPHSSGVPLSPICTAASSGHAQDLSLHRCPTGLQPPHVSPQGLCSQALLLLAGLAPAGGGH